MTKTELIAMLAPHPDDAVVRIFDADSGVMEEVTGHESGLWGRSSIFVIDLQSDDIS